MSTLWIVATPLGNSADLSPRAREILGRVDAVLAEDTRRAGLLFQRLAMPARGFVSLHDHNEAARTALVLERLGRGEELALISDAGTPLVSDPGYLLVRECRRAGHAVRPVPGPSAVVAALSASGLPPVPFAFLGFLPRKAGDLRRMLEPFAQLAMTLVCFERKDRVWPSLAVAREVLGERDCLVARELTKDHEEFILGTLGQLAASERELLGEVTLVIGPPQETPCAPEELVRQAYATEAAAGGRPKEIARRVAARCPGWSPSQVYALGLKESAG